MNLSSVRLVVRAPAGAPCGWRPGADESYCCCCWGSGAPCAAGSCCCHTCTCTQTSRTAASRAAAAAGGRARRARPARAAATLHLHPDFKDCSESCCCCCWGSGAPCAAGSCCCHPALAPRLQGMQRVVLLLLLRVGRAVRGRLVLLPPCILHPDFKKCSKSYCCCKRRVGRAVRGRLMLLPPCAAPSPQPPPGQQRARLCCAPLLQAQALQAHDGETLPGWAAPWCCCCCCCACASTPPRSFLPMPALAWPAAAHQFRSPSALQTHVTCHAGAAFALATWWSQSARRHREGYTGHCEDQRLAS